MEPGWGTCTHAHTHAHTHTHMQTYIHTHMHTYMHTCTHAHTLADMHTHAHTHAHMHTHADMHTHAHISMHTCTCGSCAGLIAAATNNVCGVGVAYGAQVSGIRLLGGLVVDATEAKAFLYKAHLNDIYSCR